MTILLTAGGISAQDETPREYICSVCGKPIIKQAVVIDGKLYHPECFRCAKCGGQIRDDYLKDAEDRYYHRECFPIPHKVVCSYCLKPITDAKYVSYQGKFYHSKCYYESVAPRCDICGEPLGDSVITDFWGTKFHPHHVKEFPSCVVCGRLIQRDGVELEPDRWMCPICAETAVSTPEKARELLEMTREKLARLGIVVTTLGLRIQLVTFGKLNEGRMSGAAAHNYAAILWNSSRSDLGESTATIKVLANLPEDLMQGVIAHELMHLWQHENGADAAPLELREGSANWASSLIYSQMGNDRGRYFLGGLEKSNDPLYGVGYRNVAKYADSHGVQGVLKMLRAEGAAAQKK